MKARERERQLESDRSAEKQRYAILQKQHEQARKQ